VYMIGKERAVSKQVLDLYERTNTHLQKFYEFFYGKTHADMEILREENDLLKKDLSKKKDLNEHTHFK